MFLLLTWNPGQSVSFQCVEETFKALSTFIGIDPPSQDIAINNAKVCFQERTSIVKGTSTEIKTL